MASKNHLLDEIETFLTETGMGPSYFGKQAVRNSEIVSRLRNGGRIWPETEAQLRAFMLAARREAKSSEQAA